MKGWYAQHKDTGKWHKIEDVKDTGVSAENKGGGNNYHLEGVGPVHQSKISDMQEKPPMKKAEQVPGGKAKNKKTSDFDPQALKEGTDHEMEHTNDRSVAQEIAMDHLTEDSDYYSKLKDVEKYDRVDEEADGKRELDYGKEELEKKPDLKERWVKMKKALSSDEAVMSIDSQEFHDEDLEEEGAQDAPDPEQEEAQDIEGLEEADQAPEEAEQVEEEPGLDPDGEGDGDMEQLAELLRQEGYSDAEVAYIVHGHMMPQSTVDDIKMDGEKQSNDNDQAAAEHELEHKKRMSDLEYDTAAQEQGINELDKDHKKRMLDLEYDAAQKEKEMELDFKRKELEQKLELQKEKAAHQLKMKKETDRARANDAGKTSQKEKAGK